MVFGRVIREYHGQGTDYGLFGVFLMLKIIPNCLHE